MPSPRWIAVAALALAALPARADVVPQTRPKPPRPVTGASTVKLVVLVDGGATRPKLVVPRNLAGSKRRAMGEGVEPATAVAGLALAGAFVSGGLWLSKRGRRMTTGLAVLLSLAVLGGTFAWANPVIVRS